MPHAGWLLCARTCAKHITGLVKLNPSKSSRLSCQNQCLMYGQPRLRAVTWRIEEMLAFI